MSKISIKNMELHYGDFHALKNVNLEIEANKITAFIGPSGCGKSTLLKSINRMNDLVEGCKIDGEILLDGKDIFRDIDVNLLRKRVGMVFQKPNPFPMSIYDNIAYGPRTHGIRSKAKLDDLVEKSLRDAAIWNECKDRLKTSALGMSGGQQQRLCIARALAVQPEVLLMDEPTSALDPISTSKIEDLAMELKKDYTIVMVTHNMQQAVRVSDNTAFFLLGEVIEYNETEKLFSIPADKRTEDYITGRFGYDMRNRFDQQLELLNEQLIRMGELCEVAIGKATTALKEGSMEQAQKVIEADEEIDQAETDIERLCLKLLLQQQPVARDLRQISAALKMITDMERIGDQASDIAEIIITEEKSEAQDIPKIIKMSEAAGKMVRDSVNAYVEKDLELSRKVIKDDDVVDELFEEVKTTLIDFIAENKGEQGGEAIDLIMVAKYLERIADHATNIAEWVEFSITGIHKASVV